MSESKFDKGIYAIEKIMMYRGKGCEEGKIELILKEAYEQGKADGEREMWEKMKEHCGFENDEKSCCHPETFDKTEVVIIYKNCNYNICPIAKGGK